MVDWIPVDVLAAIILDLALDPATSQTSADADGAQVFNLVNPRRVPFRQLVPAIASHLGKGMRVVSFENWLAELRKLDPNDKPTLEKYPALKILEFFESLKLQKSQQGVVFETDNTVKASEHMRRLTPIKEEMIEIWLKQWGL